MFVSVIESHGTYSPVTELAVNAYSKIENIEVLHSSDSYTAIGITNHMNTKTILIIANSNADIKNKHTLTLNNKEYNWVGPYTLIN